MHTQNSLCEGTNIYEKHSGFMEALMALIIINIIIIIIITDLILL